MSDLHEPDHMGVWTDAGDTVWLPRSLYPERSQAMTWAMREWSCLYLEVRCLARWMRWDSRPRDYPVDLWVECEKGDDGAFRVWRLEAA